MTISATPAARIMALFAREGFTPVDPPIMQPADVFIEKSGEQIRAHTFLFTDPDGVAELCLRPDLTVPTCRWHLQHAADPAGEAKYCYAGPVFRYHARSDTPHEYEQVGLEWFAAPDAVAAEAQVLALAVQSVRAAAEEGAHEATQATPARQEQATPVPLAITIGDIGLMRALLEDIDMPPRWRARLLRRLRRPQAFHQTLRELSGDGERARTSLSPLVDELAEQPGMEHALALAERELDARQLELVGGRTLEEIATRLLEKAENRHLPPLAQEQVAMIEQLLTIRAPLKPAIVQLGKLADAAGAASRAAWQHFAARVEHFARLLGDDARRILFDAAFGQSFDYYTGFVFEITAPVRGAAQAVAGGGRYDNMLASLGGPDVPALGMALNMPRLLAALHGQEAAA